MKALSIRQPWAWLIVNGHKNIENRSWATKFRGEFFIHAAKGMTRREYDDVVEFLLRDPKLRDLALKLPAFENMLRGGIVGRARLTNCVTESSSPWHMPGCHGFVLNHARPMDFIPMPGKLGFFNVTGTVKLCDS